MYRKIGYNQNSGKGQDALAAAEGVDNQTCPLHGLCAGALIYHEVQLNAVIQMLRDFTYIMCQRVVTGHTDIYSISVFIFGAALGSDPAKNQQTLVRVHNHLGSNCTNMQGHSQTPKMEEAKSVGLS